MIRACRRCGDEFDTHDNTRGDEYAVLCLACVADLERMGFTDVWLEKSRNSDAQH